MIDFMYKIMIGNVSIIWFNNNELLLFIGIKLFYIKLYDNMVLYLKLNKRLLGYIVYLINNLLYNFI